MRRTALILLGILSWHYSATADVQTRQLNPVLAEFGDVSANFVISTDSQWVVFSAENIIDNRKNLFSARLNNNSPALQLNDPVIDGGDIRDDIGPNFKITADNNIVVYRSLDPDSGELNLFSVSLDGSRAPQLLNNSSAQGTRVRFDFFPTNDGRVVYRSNENNLTDYEIFIVPADGSAAPVRISPDLPPGLEIIFIAGLDPTHSWAIYLLTGGIAVAPKLFAVNLDNPSLVTDLTAGLAIPEQFVETQPDWISDTHVVFTFAVGDFTPDLIYSAVLDGSTSPQLLSNFVGSEVLGIGPSSNSDASIIAYTSNNNGQSLMYVSTVDGATSPVPIAAPNGGVFTNFALFSPDSQQIVNSVEGSGTGTLFSFHTDGGGNPINLNPTGVPSLFIPEGFQITADGTTVVYLASIDSAADLDLYSAPITGGEVFRLNTQPVASPRLTDFQLTNDSQSVTYLSAEGNAFSSALDGSSPPVKLNGKLVPGGSLIELDSPFPPVTFNVAFANTPDESRFIYRADQNFVGQYELFAAGLPPLPAAANVPAVSYWSLLVLLLLIVSSYFIPAREVSQQK